MSTNIADVKAVELQRAKHALSRAIEDLDAGTNPRECMTAALDHLNGALSIDFRSALSEWVHVNSHGQTVAQVIECLIGLAVSLDESESEIVVWETANRLLSPHSLGEHPAHAKQRKTRK